MMDISRRRFALSALGLAGLGSTGGCLTLLSDAEPPFLSYRAIAVRWEEDRSQGYVADLCWLWSDGRTRLFGWEPEEYPDIVRSPTEVVVSGRTFQRLRERFAGVELVIGLSGVGATDLSLLESTLGQTTVSRERFNGVQFGDRVMVAPTDSGLRIGTIETGAHGDPAHWTVEIGRKNLLTQFPDRQVPEPT